MPNRVLREGIIDSPRIDALVRDAGWPGEVFYRRLHSVVDDYGRFEARESVLRAKCYATLLELVREADVQRWIAACVKAGLIRLYTVDGRNYLEILDFKQFTRAKKSKFPAPEDGVQCECNADALHLRTETDTNTEAEALRAPARTAEGADPANKLAEETGLAQNVNPQIRGEIRHLIALAGYDAAKDALDRAIAKKGPSRQAVLYAGGIIRSEIAERQTSNGKPKKRAAGAVREDR